jgi:hypothetical protein
VRYRLHVWPWTRHLGGRLLRNWLAIALGRHVIAWRRLNDRELAHELAHVRQWHEHGWSFPLVYVREAWRAWRAGTQWYRDNRFEIEARVAAQRAGSEPHSATDA